MKKRNIIIFSIVAIVITCVIGLITIYLNRDGFRRWRNCEDSSTCSRLRNHRPSKNPFSAYIVENVAKILEGKIFNNETGEKYVFEVHFLEYATLRFMLHEETIYRQRFQPDAALVREPSLRRFNVTERNENYVTAESDTVRIKLFLNPFKLEVYHTANGNEPAIVVNDLGRLVVEYNKRQKGLPSYEEKFDGFTDSRPYGPMAVAADFSFPKASRLYGLSQHLDKLSLHSTKDGEPYRLFNVDYASQKSRRRSMYGAVPFAIAHGAEGTAGIFWFNSAETWVDIDIPDIASSSGVTTYFMSETGLLDVFLMAGPNFYNVTRQYTFLTGTAPLPPGHHGALLIGYWFVDLEIPTLPAKLSNDLEATTNRKCPVMSLKSG